ncbi:filamentous hemagglutinin N-terminal domain-containing protein [Anabaena sp. UHCC 0204]|uniref:two-partner secretion domain-containing protein n=1 Tax=Anabaena sp. UHCC 0204 TaxID=2590009 RepID=UPI001446988D|nr:filamentous hemagglutinin N-terminal domain-containing protein [Anabaena sp. UHCC 0204]MTJ10245.1 filamentous hemagglutinin N-terminal domain-containing protein [Anabaena sp. UHCC 0204]
MKIQHLIHHFKLALFLILGTLTTEQELYAQLVPDNTLPTNSVVMSIDELNKLIEGGTINGANLFHSFAEFNVSENGSVYFHNPIGIDNILTRVTGGNISHILGTLGVEGTANLFLINPHGIHFGNSASLDIHGSFTATTADSIRLGEDGLFSADLSQNSNLLSVQPSALFTNALKNQQAIINNQGNLQVDESKNITLLGANIINTGTLIAPGGMIELTATENISIIGNISIPGNITTSSLDNDAGNIAITSEFGNIEISNSNLISTSSIEDGISSGRGGDITIQAGGTAIDKPAISLTDTTIDTAAFGNNGKSGNILISATNNGGIKLIGENQQPRIYADTFASDSQNQNQRTGGNIKIIGGDININNYIIDNTVHKNTYGNGGYIKIFGKNITVENNSKIQTNVKSNAIGDSGHIYLLADDFLYFQDSEIIANNESEGVAGKVEITGNKLVSLTKTKINSSSKNSDEENGFSYIQVTSEIGSINLNSVTFETNNSGTSYAGDIELNAGDTININNESSLNSQGNYGRVLINSQKLNIDNSTFNTNNPSSDSDAGYMEFKITELAEINNSQFTSKGNLGYISIESSSVVIDNSIFNTTNSSVESGENQLIHSGNISINAENQISILNHSQLNAFTERQGNAGNIILNSPNGSIIINNGSGLSSNVEKTGIGTGGYIDIDTQKLQLLGNSAIKTLVQPGGEGNAGNINLRNLNSLEINHSEISATSIDGLAGSINIDAKNSIEIRGEKGIAVESTGQGEAGSLNIYTSNFIIADGAKISASNTDGAGGSINIYADTFTATNGGQLITNTSGNAKAGNITLQVKENITLADANSGIFASTNPGSSGDSGSIDIDPEMFMIKNGAGIGVNSQGSGKGGDIYLQAGTLILDNNAYITAATASNQGGEINLTIRDLLLLRYGSNITATAGKSGAGGNGGNINISVPFIVALPSENSNITANAFQGDGGNINITTNTIFGLKFRDQETEFSDITASSKFGLSGEVIINRLDVDPAQGLEALSTNLVDASSQLAQSCQGGGKLARQQNQFIIVGKGGLPSQPSDLLTGTTPLVDLIDPVSTQETSQENIIPVVISKKSENSTNRVFQQVQGWVIADDGKVILTAEAQKSTLQNTGLNHPGCQVSVGGLTQ